jgi:hypothetical protein
VALELRLVPLAHLVGQEGGLGAQGSVPRVGSGRRGELVLVEGGRLMRRAGHVAFRLQKVRRGGRVVRRVHVGHVVWVERVGLVEEWLVELVALAALGRKEGEIAVAQVWRQEARLRVGVERQRGVGPGDRRLLRK